MTTSGQLRVVQVVAALLALMYVKAAWDFITTHQIELVHYSASTALETWTVRNLGVRLLAIAVGFIVALVSRNRDLLALMFVVRLVSDVGDLLNSAFTPGLEAFVVPLIAIFVAIEFACLVLLLRMRKGAYGLEAHGSHGDTR